MTDHLTFASHVVILLTAFVGLMGGVVNLVVMIIRLRQQDRKLEAIHTDVKNGNGKAHA